MTVRLKKREEAIEAIYERGVFRPLKPIEPSIPEGTRVRLIIKPSVKELLDAFEGVEAKEDVDEVFSELRRREAWPRR